MTPFSYNSREWHEARRAALVRASFRCQFCGRVVAGKGQARVDHIRTVREAPALALVPSNLRVLCVDCDAKRHAEKGNRLIERARIGLDGFPE